jgi:shikimate kinase
MTQYLKPRAVFLLGFMGAGKTSVGQALARLLQWRFVDLDQQIEMRAGRTIAEIFTRSGEEAFRDLETTVLRELLAELGDRPPAVVALGGGAALREENATLLASCGAPQVFLDAPFEVLRQRCGETVAVRPLFREEQQARLLYEARRPHYLKAHYRLDTASRSVEQAAAEIARVLSLEPTGGE